MTTIHPYLILEASTYRASVALINGARLVADAAVAMKGEREERLMPAVADILASANVQVHQLQGIICGAGPGSFTSLRIAGAIAKGMCTGAKLPMFAVSSLALMVGGLSDLPPGRYLAALDALRGEWYTVLVTTDDEGITEVGAITLCAADELPMYARSLDASLVQANPSARGIVRCLRVIRQVDIDSWEPDYGRLPAAETKRAGV